MFAQDDARHDLTRLSKVPAGQRTRGFPRCMRVSASASSVTRIALRPAEAAQALSVSRDFFEKHAWSVGVLLLRPA
jgi:hypothetical protein